MTQNDAALAQDQKGKANMGQDETKPSRQRRIWDLWEKGEAKDIIDNFMDQGTYNESEVVKCIHIGLLCVQENASDRVDMSSVLIMLGQNAIDLPNPKLPAFTSVRRRGREIVSLLIAEPGSSVNDVTFTDVQGR
ncbi:unnamed protein product [Brassica rapa subsp. trilocularis]|uniref:S-locus receptor kinase C-terminal domain-containing protein n=1 Tax=Brassica campestris TaxID=3711 RepID=M4DTM2_BRACM